MTRTSPRARVTAAGVLALAATLAVTACTTAPRRPTAPSGSPTAASAGPTGPAHAGNLPDEDGVAEQTDGPAPAAALTAAAVFAAAWARPDLDQATWYGTVGPLAIPGFAAKLATVDPQRVPASSVTGPPSAESATTTTIVARVPTDAGLLRVTCRDVDGHWLVTDLDLSRSAV